MAKVIWKGEDDLHNDDRGGPSFTIWNGVKFPKDKPVEVTNETALAKARGNRFFEVIEDEPKVNQAPKVAKIDDHKDALRSDKPGAR